MELQQDDRRPLFPREIWEEIFRVFRYEVQPIRLRQSYAEWTRLASLDMLLDSNWRHNDLSKLRAFAKAKPDWKKQIKKQMKIEHN